MTRGSSAPTDPGREQVFLCGPVFPDHLVRDERALDELAALVDSAGGEVVGRLVQPVRAVNPATYFGSGKVEELTELVRGSGAGLLAFDRELTPAQGRNLEKATGVRIIDRSELIMDIFATRARTRQAQLQVLLAQLQYKLPRLKRMWTHLDRMHAAIGARGPGETQIESDRRLIRLRIQECQERLAVMEREQHRKITSRREYKAALVGYTNAGKSTLMRALTGAEVYIADQLFATLDTTTRKMRLEGTGRPVLLSDTVGFVSLLPHHLVDSFHATLSEVLEADLLLHVVDAAHPEAAAQLDTVEEVLAGLGCRDIPTLVVANKVDRPGAQAGLLELRGRHPDLVPVSALTGEGLDRLRRIMTDDMTASWQDFDVHLPFDQGRLITRLRKETEILEEEARDDGMRYRLRASPAVAAQLGLARFAPEADRA